jgi:hypothetical protein
MTLFVSFFNFLKKAKFEELNRNALTCQENTLSERTLTEVDLAIK